MSISKVDQLHLHILSYLLWGWSGDAMVLGKLPGPGRPTNLDLSRARACCACSRCGGGLFGHFSLIYQFYLRSPSLWETARYRLKYYLKGPLNPINQPTNQLSCCVPILVTTPPPPPHTHTHTSAERIRGRSTGCRVSIHHLSWSQ